MVAMPLNYVIRNRKERKNHTAANIQPKTKKIQKNPYGCKHPTYMQQESKIIAYKQIPKISQSQNKQPETRIKQEKKKRRKEDGNLKHAKERERG